MRHDNVLTPAPSAAPACQSLRCLRARLGKGPRIAKSKGTWPQHHSPLSALTGVKGVPSQTDCTHLDNPAVFCKIAKIFHKFDGPSACRPPTPHSFEQHALARTPRLVPPLARA